MLMGNEAIALGALRAGVQVVSGYPGTPSTEILESIAKQKTLGNYPNVYVEWSVNEKSAMEVAAGAAFAGARVLVTMKQVGLNVASDPLMSLNYTGIKGGMVIAVADDPGPISSQTEQDTRRFGEFAKLMVFDPSSPEEAYTMIADAFEYSEAYGRPVILRPTTRVCHGYASVELLPDLPPREIEGFTKDGGKWVIFPRLSYNNHIIIERDLKELEHRLSSYSANSLTGSGKKGIACGGVSYAYVKEALEGVNEEYKLLKVGTVPFPADLGLEFLKGLDELIVFEELDPVIEKALIHLCGVHNLNVKIKGKLSLDTPNAGENTVSEILRRIAGFLDVAFQTSRDNALPPLPVRPPVLCAGCPHRASFFAVKEAAKGLKTVFCGDIGCYTLGNALPLEMTDTCLCMGAGLTVAQGITRAEPSRTAFAFIGDSTFFHTGLAGVVNAVYNQAEIIICILDNSTTAMTGNQPHPGLGRKVTGEPAPRLSIYDIVKAMGVSELTRVNAFDLEAGKSAVKQMLAKTGVRVILFEGLCIAVDKKGTPYSVEDETCKACSICVKKLGCPAISFKEDGKAVISPHLCTGCGVCSGVCPFNAIKEGQLNA
jgi:indolepyruvate ferredoxin oxidoreductase alpha subunit